MFRYLTAGESHGPVLTVIIEGMPAGLEISEKLIGTDMARRMLGYGRGGRMKIETDETVIRSGVRHGITFGSPITLAIENRDWVNWQEKMSIGAIDKVIEPITRLRPGHADLAGTMKYYQKDVRNILERSSARETAARVAVGAVARKLLAEFDVAIHSHVLSIGGVMAGDNSSVNWEDVEKSEVRCADPDAAIKMMAVIDEAKEAGDTVGGVVEVVATGLPIGLGSHVQWDRKIDGRLAQAIMSINAIKAVTIGDGWDSVNKKGSKVHDVINPVEDPSKPWQRNTNNAGGTEGGMTNGMPLVVRFAVKPISTLANPLPSVDLNSGEKVQAHYERSDVCQVPAAGIVGEAMVAIVMAQALQEKFGGDHIDEMKRNYDGYTATVGPRNITGDFSSNG
tara:strand:+ start:2568 stop:3752 length:1185 start_codon:yes stop_codon:yes gene_type:complete